MSEINEINEIKLPKGVDLISVKQHDDKIVIEFIPEKPKFKEGDFVYEDGRIMIVKSYPNMYHADIYPEYSNIVCYNDWYGVDFSSPTFRCAAEEEKQLLIDAMKKDGKQWNAEKLTVEDIPQPKFKRGDILISIATPGLTVIFDKVTSTTTFDSIYHNGTSSNHGWCLGLFHHATKEEKQEFFDELEVKGKRWDAEKLKIEDILKKGDLAIFWDSKYSNPLIRLYDTKRRDTHYDNMETYWDNAIKWDGTKEQFEKVLRGEI